MVPRCPRPPGQHDMQSDVGCVGQQPLQPGHGVRGCGGRQVMVVDDEVTCGPAHQDRLRS